MIFPKMKPEHEAVILKQIRMAVAQYEHAYVHGDGNIYAGISKGLPAKENSKFRQEFTNPKQIDSTYAVRIEPHNLPNNLGELKIMLEKAKNEQLEKEQEVKPEGGLAHLKEDPAAERENEILAAQRQKEAEFEKQTRLQQEADRVADLAKREAALKAKEEEFNKRVAAVQNGKQPVK